MRQTPAWLGEVVTAPTLALVLAMAGRAAFCDDLRGPGVATVRERCPGPGPA